MEITRKLELEVEPEDVAELLQLHHKGNEGGLVLMDEQRKWFLRQKLLLLKKL